MSIVGRAITVGGGKGKSFPNGTEWTQSNLTDALTSGIVLYANGLWVIAARPFQGMYYSTDGKVWTKSVTTFENNTRNPYLSYANNIWVVAHKGIYYSVDGKSWTKSNVTSNVSSLAYANGIWVAIAYEGVYYSTDGKIWTLSNLKENIASGPVNANGVWVITTQSGIYYSVDGKSWTKSNVTSNAWGNPVYADGIWIDPCYFGMYYSTDGKVWTKSDIISQNSSKEAYYAHGVWFVTVSGTGTYRSTDGKTWTKLSDTSLRIPCYAKGIWCAAGYEKNYYSEDGETWETSTIVPSGSKPYFQSIYYSNGVWVAASWHSDTDAGIYYSVDGKSWTKSNVTSGNISDVYNENGIWVAVGSSGVFYSVTWEED